MSVTARADLVMETTATMGVGPITLLGAVPGFFSFAESFTTGDVVYYCQRQKGGGREVGKGTFTAPNILSRDVILKSSVPGDPTAPVNWGDGTRVVYNCVPASELLFKEDALSEIATFLIADNHLSEIAALGGAAQDAAMGNLGALATGLALLKAATAAAARGTLGLGSAAVLAAGTAAGNALALDGAGKIPAVPGDQLTSLPAHTHSGMVAGLSVGATSTSRIVRLVSASTLGHASPADANSSGDLRNADAWRLQRLMCRGSDGLPYLPGSLVPFAAAGVVGGAAVAYGARYYLAANGQITTTPPTIDSTHAGVEVAEGVDAGLLLFWPMPAVVGPNGFTSPAALSYQDGLFRV